jgi:predicted aspartyl protease
MYLTRLDNEGNPIQSGTLEGLPDFELPLRYSNQHMVIETEIGGKKLPFLLDTGAEMTILDSRLPGKCMEVFVPRGRSKLVGSDGKKKEVITGALKAIKMGGVELKFIPAMVADLGQAFDLPISGIIGYDLLSRGIAVINTRKGLFSMYLYNRN